MRVRSEILGWVVIGYVLLQWIRLIQLEGVVVDLIRHGHVTGNWAQHAGVAAWCALLVAGIGLVRRQTWSKWVLIGASAAEILLFVVPAMSLSERKTPSMAPVLAFGAASALLPPILLLLAALRLPIPGAGESPPPMPSVGATVAPASRSEIRRLDLAYGSFAWIALLVGASLCAEYMMDANELEGYGMLLGVPLVLSAIGASGVAVVLSIRCFKERPLLIILAIMLSLLILAVVDNSRHLGSRTVLPLTAVALGTVLYFSARWFTCDRRRWRNHASPAA